MPLLPESADALRWWPKTQRAGVVLGSLLLLYGAYSFAVVPVIAPPQRPRIVLVDNQPRVALEQRAPDRALVEEIAPWFAPDSWELQNPRILQGEQLILLHRDYEALPDGSVLLKPATLIFRLDERTPEQPRSQRMIVMRAEQGATLTFDAPFNLRQPRMRKLVGGSLPGKVEIYGNTHAQAPADELRILAFDLKLQEDRILSPGAVTFRLGENEGSGRNLVITLGRSESTASSAFAFGELETVQLLQDVRLTVVDGAARLDLNNGQDRDAASTRTEPNVPRTRAGKSDDQAPLEITCQGRFIFDARRQVARFEQNVDVLRQIANGPADLLSCEALTLVLGTRTHAGTDGQFAALGKLEPRRLEAQGSPVLVRSPANQTEARGGKLSYDLVERRLTLQPLPGSADLVRIQQGGNTLAAPSCEYKLGPRGELGDILCSGPGTLSLETDGPGSPPLQANWQGELKVERADAGHVLSLLGGTHVELERQGNLDAQELWLWFQVTQGARARTGKSPGGNRREDQRLPSQGFVPSQLMAAGNVYAAASSMQLETGRLEVRFVPAPAEGTLRPNGSRDPRQAKTSPRGPEGLGKQTGPSTAAETSDRYELVADQTELSLIWGAELALSDASLTGAASVIRRSAEAGAAGESLKILGDTLSIERLPYADTVARLIGRPARMISKDVDYQAAELTYSRQQGQVTSAGAGRVLLPIDAEGSAALGLGTGGNGYNDREPLQPPENLEVQYQGGMAFDGKTLRFRDQVLATMNESQLRTAILELDVLPTMNLRQPESTTALSRPPQLEAIRCKQRVFAEHRELVAGEVASQVALDAMELEMHAPSGKTLIRGPGRVTYAGYELGGSLADLTGKPSGGSIGSAAFPPPAAPPVSPRTKGAQLNFLRVDFQQRAEGNLKQHFVNFGDRVECIYGPIKNWGDQLDPHAPGEPGPNEFTISSRQLVVRSMSPQKLQDGLELEAKQNVYLQGQGFAAQGEHMVYVKSKEHLVLEGDGTRVAQLWYTPDPQSARATLRVQRIDYFRGTNEFRFKGPEFSEGLIPNSVKLPGGLQ